MWCYLLNHQDAEKTERRAAWGLADRVLLRVPVCGRLCARFDRPLTTKQRGVRSFALLAFKSTLHQAVAQ